MADIKMKRSLNALLYSLAIITAAVILGQALLNRNTANETISVTGSSKMDFTSDLIVWEGSFNKQNLDLKKAYTDLNTDKEIVLSYLTSKGIPENEIVFSAVSSQKNSSPKYTEDGKYIGQTFTGYTLTQSVEIQSKDVIKIEKVSREITELLYKGVQFYSQMPRYYYTGLSDLKIEMISKATENARLRAEKIAENSDAKLGKLASASMGVFQITGQNSDENYSWGGAFNTSSKEKTASITMKLVYRSK